MSLLVITKTLSGLVSTLTLMRLTMVPPVKAMKTPLGLATPLIPGMAVALKVSVVTVRVLFTPQTLAMLTNPVAISMPGPIPLLPLGGMVTITWGMFVIPVG